MRSQPRQACIQIARDGGAAFRLADRARSIEHVFAHQKDRMGLFIRTIGQARAEPKIGLANLAYNLQRFLFHERRLATVDNRTSLLIRLFAGDRG